MRLANQNPGANCGSAFIDEDFGKLVSERLRNLTADEFDPADVEDVSYIMQAGDAFQSHKLNFGNDYPIKDGEIFQVKIDQLKVKHLEDPRRRIRRGELQFQLHVTPTNALVLSHFLFQGT